MEKILGEIKTGVEGVIASQKALEDKFVDSEAASKVMAEVVKTLDGRIVSLEGYFKERKALGGISLPGVTDEKRKFSFAKALVGASFQAQGKPEMWSKIGADFEHEVLSQATQKAIDSGTSGSGGGYVVPQEYVAQIIEPITPNRVGRSVDVSLLFCIQVGPKTVGWTPLCQGFEETNRKRFLGW